MLSTSFHRHPYLPSSYSHQKRHHLGADKITPTAHVTQRNQELAKQCESVTKTGVYANIGLVILKGSAGFMTNSMALIADAYHSFTDLLSDFMTYFTIKYSQREPSRKFPMGFGKIDTLGTLPVATLLTICSYHIVTSSISKLMLGASAAAITMPHVAMGCVLLSLVVKEWLYRITIKAGEEYNSSVTIANAWHHRTDAYSSLIALVGVGGYYVGFPALDPLCGIVVGVYLLKIGVDFFRLGFEQLLDRNSDLHWQLVRDVIVKCDGIRDVHELIVTQSGQYIHVNAEVLVDERLSLLRAQEIVDNVKVTLHETEGLNIQHLGIVPMVDHDHDEQPKENEKASQQAV